ncbi:hypothetical protein [Chelatococcus reniformis]|nr:hypothetical protein [Chelatococcus reniformis]
MALKAIKALGALGLLVGLSAWTPLLPGHPGPAIPVWDNSYDIMHCRKVRVVSEPVYTDAAFDQALDAMIGRTVALGGTDLYLRKNGHDWSSVTGVAYRCGRGPARHNKIIKY